MLLVEFPSLEKLVTLSPIPGFRPWLESQVQREAQQHGNEVTPNTTLSLTQWCFRRALRMSCGVFMLFVMGVVKQELHCEDGSHVLLPAEADRLRRLVDATDAGTRSSPGILLQVLEVLQGDDSGCRHQPGMVCASLTAAATTYRLPCHELAHPCQSSPRHAV